VLTPFHPKLQPKSFPDIKIISFKYFWPMSWHLLGFGRTLINDQKLKWFVYLLFPFYLSFYLLALFKTINQNKIDVINAHWILPNGFIAALVSKITRTPLVVTIPGSDAYLARKNLLLKLATNFALKVAKTTTSNSYLLLQDLSTEGQIISYPVPINQNKRLTQRHLVIATAGRVVEKKGFKILTKALPNIELISGLPIMEFRKKLATVDIFIAPSVRDARGNLDDASLVVLEAMAAGCAVITSDLPGYRNFIKSDVNGVLVKAGSSQALLKAVSSLKRSPALRLRLALQARFTIQKRFTERKIAQEYLDLFNGF
jgi:glycosyltransferase involved in cell wall biosynthesis